VYYDPRVELLTLRDLTEDEKSVRLDKVGSVSGLLFSDHDEKMPEISQLERFELDLLDVAGDGDGS